MKIVSALLAFAIATLASLAFGADALSSVSSPSLFKSLQPFAHFAKGAGEGVAYSYQPRTKAQFVALLRDSKLAKQQMRVTCDVLVRQMMEAHTGLPFEGCEGTAAAIERDSDFAVVACRDEMFQKDNFLAVTNEQGSTWGIWHRKCLPNEKVLAYKNQPLISLTCLNVAIPVSVPVAPAAKPVVPPPPVVTVKCPQGYAIVANAWSLQALPEDLRREAEEHVTSANARETENATRIDAYQTDAVSRTIGRRLREQVRTRAAITADIAVRYVDSDRELATQNVGVLRMVNGVGTFRFAEDPRQRIVGTSWPGNFVSPTISGGERRLRLFPYEWQDWCTMNIHGLVP